MKPKPIHTVLLLAISVGLLFVPAGAKIMLTDTTLQPAAVPLMPLAPQKVVAKVAIIPSGATTFPQGHSLQMRTSLSGAAWNTQVLVDGIAAAQQSASGDAAFVNGYLLSYGTNHDVSLSVAVTGAVPATPGPEVLLLKIDEIDNTGSVVPGSTITIRQPVAVAPVIPSSTLSGPAITPAQAGAGTGPAPTQAGGGLVAFAGLAACAVCTVVRAVCRKME